MVQVDLKQLVSRLNGTCSRSLETAVGLCLSRTNYNVEIEHWLLKLCEDVDNDIALILKHFDVDSSRLATDLMHSIDRLKTGNAKPPALSPDVVQLVRESWLIASIEYGSQQSRSGHLLCALLGDATLARLASGISTEFAKVSVESLRNNFTVLVGDSTEEAEATVAAPSGSTKAASKSARVGGKTPSLDQFTINLTESARQGQIDPVLGRDAEIRQIVDILTRRRQNNPILTGEAGVGKTAVVEGLALRIAQGDVPDPLLDVALHTLDLGLLQAGAGVKGEFENRLKGVIQEVKASPTPIVLFIDEAHTLIGAGGSAGQGDAANLLKPALARGELRTIAATTWAEYKKYFERDAALTRRFQVVKVEEPTHEVASQMMRGLVDTLEGHHGVRILNEAVVDAVRLSGRYVTGRQLPDKAVSVLDTTCARIAMSQDAVPASVEDIRRQIDQTTLLIEILQRESLTGASHEEEIVELTQQLEEQQALRQELEDRWQQEKTLVEEIRAKREELEGVSANGQPEIDNDDSEAGSKSTSKKRDSNADAQQSLQQLEADLRSLQGETPLVHPFVDSQAVAETISAWTGIPLGRMVADEVKTVLNLHELMEESIVGQSHALEAIAQSIRTSRAGLGDPRTPIGVFLLAGTSGVGKTETAITLANLLYGGEQNMTTINMSEFKEEHKVSLLMGAPPGYVGYGEGGVLTEAVRRKPYSVVLLDELEKANPGVQDIFYQVFDKGILKDGEGRDIDFKNTVILMTTNAGSDVVKSLCADPEMRPDAQGLTEALFPELLKTFKPAFLGRLNIVPYFPLDEDVMRKIAELKLNKVRKRFEETYKANLTVSSELLDAITARCTEVDTGARNIDHILTHTLLPELSAECLARLTEGRPVGAVTVDVGEDGQFTYEFGDSE